MLTPDQTTEDVLSHLHKVFYGDLRLCGCGQPDAAWELIHSVLTHCDTPAENQGWAALGREIGPPGAVHIVISVLTDADLIEHGGSYVVNWLTDKGKWMLWALNTIGLEDVDDRMDREFIGYPHDGGVCSPECYRIPGMVIDACVRLPRWSPHDT